MIAVRRAESDADLEAWRQVRIAVVPNERTPTVEELRRVQTSDSLHVLAELDGAVVGCGFSKRGDTGGAAVLPRVVPSARRRGVGTKLLLALAAHAESIGHSEAGSRVEDEGSLAFARRFGFREIRRDVEQVRAVRDREPRPTIPEGVGIVCLADRPELFMRMYDELALQAFEDMPTVRPLAIGPEQWQSEWTASPEGSFVALAGEEIVGFAGLILDADVPERAENTLTAVRRDWRRRGLALALKQTTIAWAAANGVREIYTWTQTGNENMRAVNERLGYTTRNVSISLRASLPLPS